MSVSLADDLYITELNGGVNSPTQNNLTELRAVAASATTRCMTGQEAIAIVRGLGISQAAFATLVGVTPQAITKWANGHPPSATMAALLRLLRERPESLEVLKGLGA